ncbi:uncharacterized protein LOC115918954 isoform X1 [Strongylocentrotus purpuratus]|uniref:Uncharacterized protein n=1 Tax=Strongylocentrotus purpuratus TaxID=7668 RepID=A0A7M7PJS3_STRPU|nr:uncharacterized protein LOC115918954 isoform X1 [Strongylocentrotus purpuratus]
MASGSISALNERLRSSAGKGNWEEIEQLLRHGATFEADKYGRTALHYAAHYGQVKTLRVCISRGCELDKVDTYGCTALHKAIAPDGHVEAVRALIGEGCDVDGQDGNGNTCVHEGAMKGFSQSMDVLIKIGKANINTSNKNGERAIHLACQHGHNQSTRILLKAGSHPDVKNSSGETPLHIACLYGQITCARILISAECDINMKNKEGNTPLHIAAGLGKLKIARLLLESQCEVKIRNKSNQTPLDVARQTDQRDAALLIIGAHRMKKGKLSFFSRNKKKDSSKLDGFGNSSHHHQSDSSPNDKHKRKHTDDRRGDDDMDGGQGGARIRGRREMEAGDRHSSGSSKGKSKKKRDKSQGQNLFVREEMKKHLKSEKKLQEQIHLGRELGNCQHTEQGNPHFRTQLFKDKTGKVLHVPMPVHCNCTPYIKKLENQVEASKERLLHEIDISKARFESRMNNMEKRMTHQAQCMDQLCKERIAAEKGDCIHRIDKRAREERKAWSEEHDARTDVLRRELRHWFESRIQPLHEQLSRTMDDAETASSTRRSRPRAGFYRLNGREVVTHRKRSKSLGNVSDCDLEEEDEEDSDEESEDESEDEEEEKEHARKNSRVKERPVSSSQPSEQSPHHYKKTETAKAKDYAKSGAIPKSSRSGSFRLAVSDEDRASGSSSNSGTPLSMVDGTYRPPLITAHEHSPNTDSHHSLPANFVFPSQETDDTESSESSESETTSQQSLETVSYKPKSISGVSSSTRDSGLHTLKGSSVSSDRRSHGPTRADLIAYQALTVNARPPPPLHAQVRPRHPVSTQPPPAELRIQASYTPPFSPPVSPTSTASQPRSTSTLASSDGHRVATPSTEQPSSDNPSPTDSGKAHSTSSGISSGEASSLQNSSPIKYNIISPHSGQSYQGTYNPRSSSSSHQPDLFKVIKSETMKKSHDEPPPPYRSKDSASSDNRYRVAQPYLQNVNNANNDQSLNQSRSNEVPPKIGHAPTLSNHYASSLPGGRTISRTDQKRIGSGSDSSTNVKTQSMGYSAAPSRSAASRLGVTPTLGAVRGVSSNNNTTSGKGLNQLHLQPRTQASQQSLPPGYSVVQGRSGSNGAVFAITRTNQSHAGNLNRPEIPVNKNNNAAPNSTSTFVHSGSITSSTSRTFNNHATSGNQYNVPAGAGTRNNGTFNAPNNNFHCSGGTKDSTSGNRATSSSHSNRTSRESYASNGTLSSDTRNPVRIGGAINGADHSSTNYTIDKRTSGTSNSIPGVNSMSTNRRSGAAFISNGASNGASLVSTVESFNRTAAPEQKLKYTREIIL